MRRLSLNKAVVYAIVIASSVLIAETAIMLLLPHIPGGTGSSFSVVVDVLLITAVLTPLLYYLLYKPLIRSYEEKEAARHKALDTLSIMTRMTHAVRGDGNEGAFREVVRSVVELTGSEFGFLAEFSICDDEAVGMNILSGSFRDNNCGEEFSGRIDNCRCLDSPSGRVIDSLRNGNIVSISKDEFHGFGLKPFDSLRCASSICILPLKGTGGSGELLGIVALGCEPGILDEDKRGYIEPILGSCANLIEIRRKAELVDLAHRRLKDSEELFRSLVETSSDWIWELDTEYRFVYSSPNVENILGLTPRNVVGKTPFDFMTGDSSEKAKDLLDGQANRLEPFSMARYSYINTSGEEVITESSGTPVVTEGGELIGFRGIDRDVTVRVRLEREKREFLGMLTHDIASPLSGASTMIESLLLVDKDVIGNPSLVSRLGTVLSSLNRPLTLIDNMSYYIRSGTHRHTLKTSSTELVGFVRGRAEYFSGLARKNGLDISISSSCTDIVCDIDQGLMERALNNLITNAIKYTPDGGKIHVDVSCTDRDVTIEVRDEGIGIPADEQAAIFERFRRSSLTGHIKGTGLGLSIVKEVAEIHGGKVSVRSEPGRGSVFTVTLPQPEPPTYNELKSGGSDCDKRSTVN